MRPSCSIATALKLPYVSDGPPCTTLRGVLSQNAVYTCDAGWFVVMSSLIRSFGVALVRDVDRSAPDAGDVAPERDPGLGRLWPVVDPAMVVAVAACATG